MQLHDAISAYVTAKQAANRSPKTLKWYSDQLSVFSEWIGDVKIGEISTFQIEQYMVAQQGTGISPSTLHARYRSLRALLNWVVSRHYLAASPMAHVEEPKQTDEEPRYITRDEFLAVVGNIATDGDWLDHRDRLICHLLFWSGLRSSELIALQHQDLRLATLTAIVRHGKGRKQRLIPLSPEIPSALTAYLYSRPEWADMTLLASSDGYGGIRGPLSNSGLRQMLRRRCRAAGVIAHLPHAWRRGFAINMLNYGVDLSWVSDMMGHEDEKTTRIYTRWLDKTISGRFAAIYERSLGD